MENVRAMAINPKQYDNPTVNWIELENSFRAHLWEYLSRYASQWKGKDIIDIGCGTGWLLDQAVKRHAKSVLGIEPSTQNIALARQHYHTIPIFQSTLEEFTPSISFDVAVSIMSLNHIENMKDAFIKIRGMLKESGEFLAVVPDYAYFRRPRYDYVVEMEMLNDGDYTVAVKRPTGTIADVVRPLEKYRGAGSNAGMSLGEIVPMPPTERLISKSPRHREANGMPLTHLLRFTVNTKA